jgi:HD superfamily phosphohydrolase
MFQQVYFHKTSRASEWMLSKLLGRVSHLLADGARIPNVPRAIEEIAREGDAPLSDYLDLDDNALWMAIVAWQAAGDPVLRDFSSRLVLRRLFKTRELHGKECEPAARARALDIARGVAKARGLDPDSYIGLDVASDTPFDDTNDPLLVVFPSGLSQKPSEVSFLLGRLRGERLERTRLIFPPELRDEIEAALDA